MLLRLILLFTIVPLVELCLLIWISGYMTFSGTIGLVLVTGLVGAALARHQGFRTYSRLQDELRRGSPPADALLDGLMILIAGALLITPGILTDVVGFLLLFPPFRRGVKTRLRERLTARMKVQFQTFGGSGVKTSPHGQSGTVIDAEFTRTGERERSPNDEEQIG